MDLLNQWEAELMVAMKEIVASPAMDWIMKLISRLGDSGFIFLVIAAILLARKRTRRYGVLLLIALAINTLVVNATLKPLLARIRPYDFAPGITPGIAPSSDYSFPSGHTSAAFAAAAAMGVAGKKPFVALTGTAVLMGISRIYLMMHYPTDVIFGAGIGVGCGYIAIAIWKKAGSRAK